MKRWLLPVPAVMHSFKLLQAWQENRGNAPSASQSSRSGEVPRQGLLNSSFPPRQGLRSSSFLPSQGLRSSFLPSQGLRRRSFLPNNSSLPSSR